MRPLLGVALLLAAGLLSANEVYHGVAVAPDGMNAWVVTIETTNVYHTTDLGTNWEFQEILTIRDFFDVFFVDDLKGWICGRVGVIFHTSNGGADWSQQNLGGPKFATRIRFFDESYGWAAGGEAILLSTTNGGSEWQPTYFPNPPYPVDTVDFQGVFFAHPDTGVLVAGRFPNGDTFAYGQGYITRTTDGGSTWELVRKDTVFDFYDVAFADGQTGWVVGGEDQTMAGVVLHTTDGGQAWVQQAVPAGTKFLRGVRFVDRNHGWACGRNGTVIHTADGGANWNLQPTGRDTTLFDIDFADTLRGMVAGNSVVLYTTDGGNAWLRGLGGIAESPGLCPGQREPRLGVLGNPCRNCVRLQVTGTDAPVAVTVLDAAGRTVGRIRSRAGGQLEWRGTDRQGLAAPAGVYLARLESAAGSVTARFVYLPAE